MDISIEVIILVFSTLSIILTGFVALYRKLSAIQVSIAKITVITDTACSKVDEMDKKQDDHEKRLTTIEAEHRTFANKHLN
jgi:uncharacterized membrane protein